MLHVIHSLLQLSNLNQNSYDEEVEHKTRYEVEKVADEENIEQQSHPKLRERQEKDDAPFSFSSHQIACL